MTDELRIVRGRHRSERLWRRALSHARDAQSGDPDARTCLLDDLSQLRRSASALRPATAARDLTILISLLDTLGHHESVQSLLDDLAAGILQDTVPVSHDAACRNQLAAVLAGRGQLTAAARLLDHMASAVTGAETRELRAHTLANTAAVALRLGNIPAAADQARRALDALTAEEVPESRSDVRMLALAVSTAAARAMGEDARADTLLPELETSVRDVVRERGSGHPASLSALVTLASAESSSARAAGDRERLQRATDVLAIAAQKASALMGPEHPQAVSATLALATAEYESAKSSGSRQRIDDAKELMAAAAERAGALLPDASAVRNLRDPRSPRGSENTRSAEAAAGGLAELDIGELGDIAAVNTEAATAQEEVHSLRADPPPVSEQRSAPEHAGYAVAKESQPQQPSGTTEAPAATSATACNRRLAAFIAEAGFTQAGLARRIDQLGQEHGLDQRYDETSVARWLRGQQPRGSTRALIAEVFNRRLGRGVSAADLGLDPITVYTGLEYATTPQEAVDIVSCLWRTDAGDLVELRKVAFTPAGLVVPSRDWLIGRADERVAQTPHRQPRAGHGGKGPTRVLPGDISALRSVGEFFRKLDEAYGGGHARQELITCLAHELEPLLRGTYDEETGRRLFAVASDLTRLTGWTSYDLAAHGIAQRYFVQALRLAQAAGDRGFGAYVLVTMSQQAAYLGHGREAVQLARVAQQGVGTDVSPIVQTMLYAAEARGHALLGEVRACTASLTRADRAFETARPGDEVPHWACFVDEAQLLDDFAHCHRDLQQFRAAARHAERSLRLRAPGYARSSLLCKVVLATARLGLGELDQACRLAAEAAGQTAEMSSTRVIEYIKDFERRLGPFRNTADARAYYRRASAG
ncbi:hypothetical protein GCM10010252_26480 [Streptomyces aureoverticillatus]|nr:hypothetical protein GCM10010252_26480 [Streptomyces aureoverticillatus]